MGKEEATQIQRIEPIKLPGSLALQFCVPSNAVSGNEPSEAQMTEESRTKLAFRLASDMSNVDESGYCQNQSIQEDVDAEDIPSSISKKGMGLILEYAKLASLRDLSGRQANRLGELLEMAVEDEILSFWFIEVDHILGHKLDLLREDDREAYKDQEAILVDYLGVMHNFPIPKDKQIEDYICDGACSPDEKIASCP